MSSMSVNKIKCTAVFIYTWVLFISAAKIVDKVLTGKVIIELQDTQKGDNFLYLLHERDPVNRLNYTIALNLSKVCHCTSFVSLVSYDYIYIMPIM